MSENEKPDRGPEKPRIYVSAIICERALREADSNLISAIRIAEGFNPVSFEIQLPNGGVSVNYFPVEFVIIVKIHSEKPRNAIFSVKGVAETGEPLKGTEGLFRIDLLGGVEGQTFNITVKIPGARAGTHWLEFYIDEELATKLPFLIKTGSRVEVDKQTQGQAQKSEPPPNSPGQLEKS